MVTYSGGGRKEGGREEGRKGVAVRLRNSLKLDFGKGWASEDGRARHDP